MRIVFDTNFLIDCVRFKIDLGELAGNELFVLEPMLFEIEKIMKRGSKESKFAKVALDFVKRSGIKVLETKEKNVDKALISFAKQRYVIATDDMELEKRLKEIGSKVVFIRQRKYIETK